MRVQPDWPMRPFTAITMRAVGFAVVTWRAASMPAPPAPRMRTSAEISSRGNNAGLRRNKVRVASECRHTPVGDDDADEQDDDRDRRAEACAPGVIEADVADTVEAVVEGDEQERDIDGDEPRIAKKSLLDD